MPGYCNPQAADNLRRNLRKWVCETLRCIHMPRAVPSSPTSAPTSFSSSDLQNSKATSSTYKVFPTLHTLYYDDQN